MVAGPVQLFVGYQLRCKCGQFATKVYYAKSALQQEITSPNQLNSSTLEALHAKSYQEGLSHVRAVGKNWGQDKEHFWILGEQYVYVGRETWHQLNQENCGGKKEKR